jgi:hypothetical protein
MITRQNLPINIPADQDCWTYLVAMYESWPTERLQAEQEYFRNAIERSQNQNWIARCARPNLGLITILLLLRQC